MKQVTIITQSQFKSANAYAERCEWILERFLKAAATKFNQIEGNNSVFAMTS